MAKIDRLLQSAMRMKLTDQFDYIENGEKKFVRISTYGETINTMSDDVFVDFMTAAFSPESIEYRNRGLV